MILEFVDQAGNLLDARSEEIAVPRVGDAVEVNCTSFRVMDLRWNYGDEHRTTVKVTLSPNGGASPFHPFWG